MKVALCFIISYEHIVNKEHLWKEWIEPNKDIINVYFHYKDFSKIKSNWIAQHVMPPKFIFKTTYYHVVPAYISLLEYARQHDSANQWFCILSDSCCPIISPQDFRTLFFRHNETSFFSWRPAWWDPYFHKRANLSKIPKDLWLANDPWFVLTKKHVLQVLHFVKHEPTMSYTICSGIIANETIFAVIFKLYNELNTDSIRCVASHLTDWSRQTSPTSPYLFKDANHQDIDFIEQELERNKYAMFIRKVSPEFPDEILKYYIYEYPRKGMLNKKILNYIEYVRFFSYILYIGVILCILFCTAVYLNGI